MNGDNVSVTMYIERRKIRFWMLVVALVMVCLHLRIDYFFLNKCCASSHYTFRTLLNATALGAEREHDAERNAAEKTWFDVCRGEVEPGAIRGSVLLANHSTTMLHSGYVFDPDRGQDVMVFLHIQKTGGTIFGRHLVSDLDLSTPCRCDEPLKKCECRNADGDIWMVNRYSTGWRCGLHADWTELTQCVDGMLDRLEGRHRDRRYLYITVLRDPYTRYLSEYKHVQRGATWKAARLQCDGRQASLEEVPFCFDGANWTGVTLPEFLSCPHNLANNRQVRMLANLSLGGCYRRDSTPPEVRQCVWLRSAMKNLLQVAFFGLTEYQRETQYLFERTFGVAFRQDFVQYKRTHAGEVVVQPRYVRDILDRNGLDLRLYAYAKRVFFRRLAAHLKRDAHLLKDGLRSWSYGKLGDNRARNGVLSFSSDDYEESDDFAEEGEEDDEDDEEFNRRITT